MSVIYPEVTTEQIGEHSWVADCDGFEAIGGTESEAIDAVNHKIRQFVINERKNHGETR